MKKTIVSTNWLNKVIAAMMMMAITSAMPAMAGNKKHNNGKNNKVVVVVDKKTTHLNAHKHVYRPHCGLMTSMRFWQDIFMMISRIFIPYYSITTYNALIH